jgi:thymidylate synthase (FAD)
MIQFVKDSFEFIPQKPGLDGAYAMAELAARTCYKSENYIKEGSAHKIVDEICIKNGHTSIAEFATIYLKVKIWNVHMIRKYIDDRYSRVRIHNTYAYITTTLRTIIQGDYEDPIESIEKHYDKNWGDDLKYICNEPELYHYKRYCYRFECDRVGSQSFMRHRGIYGISYAQESTRYCNYNGKKFGGVIKIGLSSKFYELIDKWSKVDDGSEKDYSYITDFTLEQQLDFLYKNDLSWKLYVDGLNNDADIYINLINSGWKPEDARGKLPLDLNTTFMMCAYLEDWKMWLYRRDDSHAHPHIQKIARGIKNDMKRRGILK